MKQKANNCRKLNMFLQIAVSLSHFLVYKPNIIFIKLHSVFLYFLFKLLGPPSFEAKLILVTSDFNIPKVLLLVLNTKRPPQDSVKHPT